jgi:hypothetical protein
VAAHRPGVERVLDGLDHRDAPAAKPLDVPRRRMEPNAARISIA